MRDKKDNVELTEIFQTALGTFDHRQPYSPGMFEPLKPLFADLGYEAAAIYIADDYPDRMRLACSHGDGGAFPRHIALNGKKTLYDEFLLKLSGVPDILTGRLFSHGRELGAIAAIAPGGRGKHARALFDTLARSVSVMAYVERIRTNGRRERVERDVFFAHSLANRLITRDAPDVKNLRIGFERIRCLEAGGEFLDLIPERDGSLFGLVGRCNGSGLRTVLEVTGILRAIHHACHRRDEPACIARAVNDYLVQEKRRAHQASLVLFRVDPARRKLTLVKSGRVRILLCGPGAGTTDASAPGSMFLGMVDRPEIRQDEYDFHPGQAFFCMTDGFYSPRDRLNADPQARWLAECVAAAFVRKRRKPLANAVFDSIGGTGGADGRPGDSLLALSVEFTEEKRRSARTGTT